MINEIFDFFLSQFGIELDNTELTYINDLVLKKQTKFKLKNAFNFLNMKDYEDEIEKRNKILLLIRSDRFKFIVQNEIDKLENDVESARRMTEAMEKMK